MVTDDPISRRRRLFLKIVHFMIGFNYPISNGSPAYRAGLPEEEFRSYCAP